MTGPQCATTSAASSKTRSRWIRPVSALNPAVRAARSGSQRRRSPPGAALRRPARCSRTRRIPSRRCSAHGRRVHDWGRTTRKNGPLSRSGGQAGFPQTERNASRTGGQIPRAGTHRELEMGARPAQACLNRADETYRRCMGPMLTRARAWFPTLRGFEEDLYQAAWASLLGNSRPIDDLEKYLEAAVYSAGLKELRRRRRRPTASLSVVRRGLDEQWRRLCELGADRYHGRTVRGHAGTLCAGV